jgi:transcriptional regulator with XRE-family HTH domain
MNIDEKIRGVLNRRGMTPAQLGRIAGLSRPTMSRIMRGHIPSEDTLARIASVLEVTPGYLRGGYTLTTHLTGEDLLTLADLRCLPYLRLVRGLAENGVTAEDLRKLIDILEKAPD